MVHFHHEGQSRERMWGDAPLFPWDADVPALTLCDHNCVVLPGYDFEQTSSHAALRHVLAAREREVSCLGRLGLVDAWTLAHPVEDTPDELRPKGWTWGFPAHKEDQSEEAQLKRQVGLRRIDRIHVSSSIIPAVTGAYTARVANSHFSMHKSVGITEVAAYVRASSSDYVCPAGVALLKQRGYVLATSREQYMALVRPMELELDKSATSPVFDKLLVELQTTASAPRERAQRKQEIFRLMRQLQERKR